MASPPAQFSDPLHEEQVDSTTTTKIEPLRPFDNRTTSRVRAVGLPSRCRTDSCFALSCQLGNSGGPHRIREIRHLDDKHHFTLVCRDFAQLGQFVHVSNTAFRLKERLDHAVEAVIDSATAVPSRLP